jgi:hypothetical protein
MFLICFPIIFQANILTSMLICSKVSSVLILDVMSVDMNSKEYKKTFNDVQNEFRLISSTDEVFSKWYRIIFTTSKEILYAWRIEFLLKQLQVE